MQTEEQRKAAYEAAGLAYNPQNLGGVITGKDLTSVTSPNFRTSVNSPIVPITGIDTTTQNTANNLSTSEQGVSDLTKRITDLQNSLLGKSAYITEQETKYGLSDLQKTQEELTAQIKGYQLESQGLENAAQYTIPNLLQEQSTGRGITAGGLAPIQASELRKVQIKQGEIASRALTTSAALEAIKGRINVAQNQIDRAVVAKYGPAEESIKVALANLEVLSKNPSLTLDQQKRLNAQKEIQERKQVELDRQKEDYKTLQGLGLQASQNGAPAAIISSIMSSKDIMTAIKNGTGYLQKETIASIQEYQFAVRNGYKGSFSQYQDEDANRKKAIARAGAFVGGLPNNIATQVDKLSSAFDSSPIVKTYNEIQNKKLSIDSIIGSGIKGPGDLAIVYEFMKALDPTSVVRETEYANAAASGNIFLGWAARFNGYLKEGGGFLPENVKRDFQSLINKKFEVSAQQYQNLRKETARKINIKTGSSDGLDYLTNYEAATKSIGNKDTSTIDSDIQLAIKDIINFPNRERLIEALMREYGISKEEAASKVYTIWKDNTIR